MIFERATILIVSICVMSCSNEPDIDMVLFSLTFNKSEIFADRSSTATASVMISKQSSVDRRTVKFTINNGTFTDGSKSKLVTASFESGNLVAKTTFKSTTNPGSIIIAAQPEFDSPIREYVIIDSILATPSIPASILANPSSLGISTNYLSEVSLKGKLINDKGKDVSKGYNVVFEDYLQNGDDASGRFRNSVTTTTDSSNISTIYGASAHPIGTDIHIVTTLLNSDGTKSTLSKTTIVTVNQ